MRVTDGRGAVESRPLPIGGVIESRSPPIGGVVEFWPIPYHLLVAPPGDN